MRRKRFDSQIAILLSALQADRGRWWTLAQLHAVTGICETSLSAQLRNLRKEQHGAHTIEVRCLNEGVYTREYRLGDS